jgi:hypothetical protein
MTTKKKTTGKSDIRKLKLKKETVRDLDAKGTGKNVKGGSAVTCATCAAGVICVYQTAFTNCQQVTCACAPMGMKR